MVLQGVSVPTPIVSFLSLRVFDGCESSVEPCQSLDGLGIAYTTETGQSMAWPGAVVDEHTIVVDTINDFFPYSSVAPGILGPQREVVRRGSQYT
jgi:hypothetical protein